MNSVSRSQRSSLTVSIAPLYTTLPVAKVQQGQGVEQRRKEVSSSSVSSAHTHTTTQSLTTTAATPSSSVRRASDLWYCHCCGFKNTFAVNKCKVCGRPESFALPGYHLPLHGENAAVYRPSQAITVLEDVHETDSEQWTALHAACARGDTAMVRQLLLYKAQTEALTLRGHTPLHLAVHSGSLDCVAELLKKGVEVNVATFEERHTPLHMACEGGFARITQTLLQAKADIHAQNILGRTPLHCAAMSGRTDIVLLLLRAGAKLHAVDLHGWEACQLAELMHHTEVQELLIREGMTEKQAVLKDLPPAKWQSDIWHEVVRIRTQRKIDQERELTREDDEKMKIRKLQEDARKKRLLMIKIDKDGGDDDISRL